MGTLVVIHGLGDSARAWGRFAAAMTEWNVVTFDLPGHGQAEAGRDYTYGGLVASLAGEVEGLDRFALLGHSMGAAVACLYAARNPGRVTHLVLVEPAAPHQSPFLRGPLPGPGHVFTFGSVEEALEALAGMDPRASEEDIRVAYREREDGRWEPAYDPAIHRPLVEDARANGAAYRDELGAIRVPTLVVGGEMSFLAPPQLEEIAAAIPDASLSTIRGANHSIHSHWAGELAQAVTEFLAGRTLGVPDWY